MGGQMGLVGGRRGGSPPNLKPLSLISPGLCLVCSETGWGPAMGSREQHFCVPAMARVPTCG